MTPESNDQVWDRIGGAVRGAAPEVPELTAEEKGTTMAKTIDPGLAARLREESEQTKDEPYPKNVKAARPNRPKVYSVRLSAEEEEAVQRVADAQHLPASTLVRAWILERLDRERPA